MAVKKQIIINLGDGNFEEGFSQTIINIQEIGENNKDNFIQLSYKIPQFISTYDIYKTWKINYENISQFLARGFKDGITNLKVVTIEECNQNVEDLRESLNHWLSPVKKKLEQAIEINAEDEIDVVIQTHNINSPKTKEIVQKLPWHWWDFFRRENFTDVALSFSSTEEIHSISTEELSLLPTPKRVKILCILGENTLGNSKDNIDVEADRRFLRKIPGAYCVFLRQPKRSEFIEFMSKERWDILYFSGHSATSQKDSNTGLLYLNNQEKELDIQEIREIIQTGINQYQGMKLAIFNSCDGLGLARQLADLEIAQIIIWREPVPDEIAQEFLKSFLNFFSNTGLSLYRSVQKARLEIQEYINGKEDELKVSWLPVIHHNLAKESIYWKQLRGLPDTVSAQKNTPRESLLNKVKESWIRGVLDKSLHIEETIELGLYERLDAVIYSSRIKGEDSNQQNRDLPEGTRAIDIFGELKNKKTMLILGEAGSGKTTALLEIARECINDAFQDTTLPIPVVLNLSTWAGEKKQKPLADWLVKELNRIYQFSVKQCHNWVNNQQLLLLLDGLDEVRESLRGDCIITINQFLRDYERTEIVVCSRIEDYNQVSEKLQFQSAVVYKSLTEEQIDRYFDDAKEELSAVKDLKEEDKAIQELVKNPLTLHIIAVAYKNKSREELLQIESLEERRYHLFDTYIKQRLEEDLLSNFGLTALEPGKLKYSKKQSLHWLSWLGQKMTHKSQKVLLIEQIQPDWLQTNTQKWTYLIIFRLILGLIIGLILVLHFGTQVTDDLRVQISLAIPSVIASSASSLISLALFSFMPRIILIFLPRRIPRRISRFISRFIPGVLSGLFFLIIAAPIVYAIVEKSLEKEWKQELSPLIIDGVAIAIFLSLIEQDIGIIDNFKQSWQKARIYSLVGLICGIIYVLVRLLLTNRYDLNNPKHLFDVLIELLIFTILPGLLGLIDKGENIEQTIIPNHGVWRSAKNASFFFAIFFPTGILCSFNYSKGGIHEVISIGLAVGLLAAIAGGKGPVFAGVVLIQHFTLRIILWLKGFTPWNYARFLDYATERIFLRKVGGGYIFIHRMLQEHFAKLPLGRNF